MTRSPKEADQPISSRSFSATLEATLGCRRYLYMGLFFEIFAVLDGNINAFLSAALVPGRLRPGDLPHGLGGL